jgi:hypothetical protein
MSPNSDPRLIKDEVEALHSKIVGLSQDAWKNLLEIKSKDADDPNIPHIRRALVSLVSAIELMNTLLLISLNPYLRELDERIAELEKK